MKSFKTINAWWLLFLKETQEEYNLKVLPAFSQLLAARGIRQWPQLLYCAHLKWMHN